ncbi:hypothetical protein SDC9_54181 [bioreactor metagenome]|uniref:Apea-like HEPN domain-containing protein n=1 Tax=bioreactor metagenome TaxID=1076179 RepID=A0A644WVN6_9ZZZZ|nr:hypothetical protein [Macellibacteroides fermentans]
MKHVLREFFKERIREVFHKDTIDSHRVRFHNTNSLLKELRSLIIDWRKNKIKQFDTVSLCATELIDSLKADEYISMERYNKELFIEDLKKLAKSEGKNLNAVDELFILDILIERNRIKYLSVLFIKLEEYLNTEEDYTEEKFVPKIKQVDDLISKLGTELINCGFSKSYIYACVNQMTKKPDFDSQFIIFKSKFLTKYVPEFVVIYKIWTAGTQLLDYGIPYVFEEVPEVYLCDKVKNKHPKLVQKEEGCCFFIFKSKSKDYYNAIKNSKAKLAFLLDQVHLGVTNVNILIPDTAIVIDLANKDKGTSQPTNYIMDGRFGSDISLFLRFHSLIGAVERNNNIEQDVKDRLNSALRYLRMGNTTVEMEQRFINYWIALEFLFSSPETDENTFARLKTHLINILYCSYPRRNLLFLNKELVKQGYVVSGTCFSIENIDNLISSITSPLLKYRMHNIKSKLFNHTDKRKDYLNNHETNLTRHMVRIYRLRNELIHEAAIKQDIENITSNLRYYLVFLLNQAIVYFSNVSVHKYDCKKKVSMNDFFSEYIILKKLIQQKYDLDVIMHIPLEIDLIS